MKKMKKVLASLLAATMVMSMSVTAWAEELVMTTDPNQTYETLIKAYAIPDSLDIDLNGDGEIGEDELSKNTVYPAETLTFTSKADEGNPKTGQEYNLTIADLTINRVGGHNLTVNLPTYDQAGKYKYTISETSGNGQGVTYTGDEIELSVLVYYDYDSTTGYGLIAEVNSITIKDETTKAKKTDFTNKYDLGHLNVKKTVSGNLADKSKEFSIYVTFKASSTVLSDISYVEDSEIKTIEASALADGVEKITITPKHDETVAFYNIPAGVTYAIEEDTKHTSGNKETTEEGYTATYTNEKGTVEAGKTIDAVVLNTRETEVETGIILDSAPYILLLAFAAMGVFAVVNKKREEEF